jgi:hypothetical protein
MAQAVSLAQKTAVTMDLRRVCIHEAGHFYVAYKHRPLRAVSICISRQTQVDPLTREEYASVGQAVTFEPNDGLTVVHLRVRAAGLAAESLVYGQPFEELMATPAVRRSIKTDTDNAKRDLVNEGLPVTSEAEFLSSYWRRGFDDAVIMMRSSVDKLHRIADYCLLNLDRTIPRAELVENCDL